MVDRPLSGKEESALRGRNEARRVRIGGAACVVCFRLAFDCNLEWDPPCKDRGHNAWHKALVRVHEDGSMVCEKEHELDAEDKV